MEAQLEPLQNDATICAGKRLTVPDPARMVRFIIRSKGTPMGGEITFECCPMDTGQAPKVSAGMVWRALKTVPVPTDIFATAQYYAGKVSGVFRARISSAITGGTGTVSVWPLVGVLIGNANDYTFDATSP
jgi:hypothetical protein